MAYSMVSSRIWLYLRSQSELAGKAKVSEKRAGNISEGGGGRGEAHSSLSSPLCCIMEPVTI